MYTHTYIVGTVVLQDFYKMGIIIMDPEDAYIDGVSGTCTFLNPPFPVLKAGHPVYARAMLASSMWFICSIIPCQL